MDADDVLEMIKRHEGYRDKVYLDSKGVPTVGYGHALQVGSKVSLAVADKLFWDDMRSVYDDYSTLGIDLEADTVRKAVLLDLLFNLGLPRLLMFKRFLAAVRAGEWAKAEYELVESKWHKQVGVRAEELEQMIFSGEYPPTSDGSDGSDG